MQRLTVIAALLALGACSMNLNQHVTDAQTSHELRPGNRVDLVQFNHNVAFVGGEVRPSPAETENLNAFVRDIHMSYGDEVTLRGSSPQRRNALAAQLAGLGLPVQIRSEPGDPKEAQANTVRVLVERHVVTPPACPNWSNLEGAYNRNTPGSNYGCATDSALGYMIANPRDLVAPQAVSPTPAPPMVGAMQRYQTDQVKKPASTTTGGL